MKNQSGNVLFLILIAVALFATLSYAVTSSSRTGKGDISSENTAIDSAKLLDYLSQARVAAQRMRLINRCSTIYYYNPIVPQCALISPTGGSMTPWRNWDVNYMWQVNVSVGDTPVAGVGTTESDTVLTISRPTYTDKENFSDKTCTEINNKISVPGNPDCSIYPPFGGQINTNSPPTEQLNGHRVFCFANTNACGYALGQAVAEVVLFER